jgi:hypothetical protein
LLPGAVAVEPMLLVVFLAVPAVAATLGCTWPAPGGWALAALAIPTLLAADATHEWVIGQRARNRPPR